MCGEDDWAVPDRMRSVITNGAQRKGDNTWRLDEVAEVLTQLPEDRAPQVGFIGYGDTKVGDKILIAADTHYDQVVLDTFAAALREKGASVDVLVTNAEPDREFDYLDEIRSTIRDTHWTNHPRRWEGIPYVEEFAKSAGYDLLLHGRGGPTPATDHRYEQFPWLKKEHLSQGAGAFPRDLHSEINMNTWNRIWGSSGGTVRLTDPEGTDLTFTMHPEYFDGSRRNFTEKPTRAFGHLLGHAPTPIIDKEDATGVIAGTTSHVGRPFPRIKVHLEGGRVEAIEGGGPYGDAWRQLLQETKDIQYPDFPRPGLFWLWEVAIGTNPWTVRSPNVNMVSSGGFEWERRRSGVIHCGLGTRWRSGQEAWAGERGIKYGHLHVHLLFPTYKIHHEGGSVETVIDNGRLAALDHPDVRKIASTYGDPSDLLTERWIPKVPGISAPGNYDDFAVDPAPYIYADSGAR